MSSPADPTQARLQAAQCVNPPRPHAQEAAKSLQGTAVESRLRSVDSRPLCRLRIAGSKGVLDHDR
jgi:hypothetical protein